MTGQITVRDNPQARVYDALLDGETIGTLIYELEGGRIVLRHTIVDPEYRSEGVGTEMVREVLDDIRGRGLTVTNYCSFVSEFIDAHPDYADLIDPAHPGHVIRPEPRR